MGVKRRADAVQRFMNDPNARVLLMSSVGMVGLNLTVADVVIAYVSSAFPTRVPSHNETTRRICPGPR